MMINNITNTTATINLSNNTIINDESSSIKLTGDSYVTSLEANDTTYSNILREYSKNDKKSFYVIPTEKAKKLVKVTEKKMSKYLKQIENSLGKEHFDKLLQMLTDTNRILKNIKGEEL